MAKNGRKRFKRIGQGLAFGLKEFGKVGKDIGKETAVEIRKLQRESQRQRKVMLTPEEKLMRLSKKQRSLAKQIRVERKKIVKSRRGLF